jgi:putative DNA primase/helicase
MSDVIRLRSRVAKATSIQPPDPDERDLARKLKNDIGNAERLRARYGHSLLSVAEVGWHIWDGCRWDGQDGDTLALRYAHLTAKAIFDEANELEREGSSEPEEIEAHRKWASQSGNSPKLKAMLEHAMPYMRSHPRDLDNDNFLFNCENGTICLRPVNNEGRVELSIRAHDPADLITKRAPVRYEPDAVASHWLNFLCDILPDKEVRTFVQRFIGYCMTGDISEQVLALFYGTGSNGKSTFLETVAEIMGDYSTTAAIQTFLHDDRKRGGEATPDLARLPGARLVGAAEPDAGARLSESVVKTITGGERIAARHLNKDIFEFLPRFKLIISCNQKPYVGGQDEGIWRRLLMVPFTEYIPLERRDRHLRAKLRAEAPGILNWMLDGYREWRLLGLQVPAAVRQATDEYRMDSDPIGEFVRANTQRKEGSSATAKTLYTTYCGWCRDNATKPQSMNAFGRRLGDLGFRKEKVGVTIYQGIEILKDSLEKFADAPMPDGEE